jgi:RNA polymerase sigma factor (sigma-70 family)
MRSASTPSPQELALLGHVVRNVALGWRLSPDDALDFGQTVHVRLLERDYDVFRLFSGRCSLKTYLTTVVRRMLIDWRRSLHGKWRPSAAARRLGDHAVLLDRLIHRDNHPPDEAVRIVLALRGAPAEGELIRLADLLPPRMPRRMTSVESADEVAWRNFDDPIEQLEARRLATHRRERLRTAVRQLALEDRRLLDLRYRQCRPMPEIARSLGTDAKALYRRCDRVLRSLRDSLEGPA